MRKLGASRTIHCWMVSTAAIRRGYLGGKRIYKSGVFGQHEWIYPLRRSAVGLNTQHW